MSIDRARVTKVNPEREGHAVEVKKQEATSSRTSHLLTQVKLKFGSVKCNKDFCMMSKNGEVRSRWSSKAPKYKDLDQDGHQCPESVGCHRSVLTRCLCRSNGGGCRGILDNRLNQSTLWDWITVYAFFPLMALSSTSLGSY